MSTFQISCLTKLANDIFRKKESKPRLWCFGASDCFVISQILRKQALSKKFNATYWQKIKSNSRFMKP